MNQSPTLVIPVGVAGSGKSTYYQQHYPTFTQVSADTWRYKINNHKQPDNNTEEKVWQETGRQLAQAIKQRNNIFYDNTNRSRKRRSILYQQAKQHQYHVIAVWFVLPMVTLVNRDQQRPDRVGREVQWHQLCSIDPPIIGVDCDEIITVTTTDTMVKHNVYQFCNHFMALNDNIAQRYELQTQQPEHDYYHDNSIVAHDFDAYTLGVNSGNEQLATVAQWHDLGKIFTRSYDPMYARVHYYNHEIVSSYLYASYCVYHHQYNQLAMQTSQLIRWHMILFDNNISRKLQQRERLTTTMCNTLNQFHRIDIITT